MFIILSQHTEIKNQTHDAVNQYTTQHNVKYVRHIVVEYSYRLGHPTKARTYFKLNLINARRPKAWGDPLLCVEQQSMFTYIENIVSMHKS